MGGMIWAIMEEPLTDRYRIPPLGTISDNDVFIYILFHIWIIK